MRSQDGEFAFTKRLYTVQPQYELILFVWHQRLNCCHIQFLYIFAPLRRCLLHIRTVCRLSMFYVYTAIIADWYL